MPDITLKFDFVSVLFSTDKYHAARMFTPGPIMSGFNIPGLA